MGFTFKKHEKTGRFGWVQKDFTDIKLNKKKVGLIQELEGKSYRIGFMITKTPTKDYPADFEWTYIKQRFDSEQNAKKWIENNSERKKLMKNYEVMYSAEDGSNGGRIIHFRAADIVAAKQYAEYHGDFYCRGAVLSIKEIDKIDPICLEED
jgi:hypothetical protein